MELLAELAGTFLAVAVSVALPLLILQGILGSLLKGAMGEQADDFQPFPVWLSGRQEHYRFIFRDHANVAGATRLLLTLLRIVAVSFVVLVVTAFAISMVLELAE